MSNMSLSGQAWLNEKEGGCKFSKHFVNEVLENPTVHIKVKSIEIKVSKTSGVFSAYLYWEDGRIAYKLVDSGDVRGYVQFIIDNT